MQREWVVGSVSCVSETAIGFILARKDVSRVAKVSSHGIGFDRDVGRARAGVVYYSAVDGNIRTGRAPIARRNIGVLALLHISEPT